MPCQRFVTPRGGAKISRLSRKAMCFLLGLTLCCLLGADIAFDPNSPVPNPNNMPLTIEGSGTYNLEKGERLSMMLFMARCKANGQIFYNSVYLDFVNKKWQQKLLVNPAGDYECWAYIEARNENNEKVENTTKVVTINVK
ncbi:MAG: hypothetical protein WHU94_17080 [Thermogemmata sp.]|nr:hypothetical protein [Thermogemmata fonticola]